MLDQIEAALHAGKTLFSQDRQEQEDGDSSASHQQTCSEVSVAVFGFGDDDCNL